jgi:hypothetical protein
MTKFPLHVLSESYKNRTPQEAFELFCQLMEEEYGQNLSDAEKKSFFDRAASFFEENSQPELAAECKKKRLALEHEHR